MRTAFLSLLLCSAFVQAQTPVISPDGITNSATYLGSGYPASGIAAGSIFLVFGSFLGPAKLAQAASFPLPTQLSGTSIQISVGSTAAKAIVLYTSATQVAAILPSTVPPGDGTFTLSYQGATSAPAPIHVVKNNFGAYTLGQSGFGPGVMTNASYSVSTLGTPLKPSDAVILWGTGLGAVAGDEAGGPLPGDLGVNAQVYVGGQVAPVLYAGRSGCCSGLDQIVFTIPAGVQGCYVPVAVRVGGVTSNFTTLSVAPQGVNCQDPYSLPSAVIAKAAGGSTVNLGVIELLRLAFTISNGNGTINANSDTAEAFFGAYSGNALFSSLGVPNISPSGSCTVITCKGLICDPYAKQLGTATVLDAGTKLNITGPVGPRSITKPAGGIPTEYYGVIGGYNINDPSLAPLADYLETGSYTVTGGGSNVGSFSAATTAPQTLTWTNMSDIGRSSQRGVGITVTWANAKTEYVVILGTSATADGKSAAIFSCLEKASAGKFTVPGWVTSVLPQSGPISYSGQFIQAGFLLLGNYNPPAQFAAPGLDLGYLQELTLSGKNVAWQ